jgi:hypothetical protein
MTISKIAQIYSVNTFKAVSLYAGNKIVNRYGHQLEVNKLSNINDSITWRVLE